MSVSSQWWAKGRNQEQMLISSPWISHSPGQASQMREQHTHILTLHLPLSCLSCSLLSFGSPASHFVGCHFSTQPTHPPTVGAACIIWANLCSLAPSQLLAPRCLHLGLAPASSGWIFTPCLWALPQEVPVLCGSCCAIFDPSLSQVHMKLSRLFFPFFCEHNSAHPSTLHTAGWLHSGQLCSQGFTPVLTQCWGTSASLRIKLISLGLKLCFDLSEWSWSAAGQHGQCLWHTPRLTAPCGVAQGISSNSTELPGLVPSLSLVSVLKKGDWCLGSGEW